MQEPFSAPSYLKGERKGVRERGGRRERGKGREGGRGERSRGVWFHLRLGNSDWETYL